MIGCQRRLACGILALFRLESSGVRPSLIRLGLMSTISDSHDVTCDICEARASRICVRDVYAMGPCGT